MPRVGEPLSEGSGLGQQARVKLALGLGCIGAALAVLLSAPDRRQLTGTYALMSVIDPYGLFPLPWRLLVTMLLLALGMYVVLLAIRPAGTLRIVLWAWVGIYLVYIGLLWSAGHAMVIQRFDFGQPMDLPYLVLLGLLVGIVLRIESDLALNADLPGLVVAVAAVLLATASVSLREVAGVPADSGVVVLGFALGVPGYIVGALSILSLALNSLRLVWKETCEALAGLKHLDQSPGRRSAVILIVAALILLLSAYILTADIASAISASAD